MTTDERERRFLPMDDTDMIRLALAGIKEQNQRIKRLEDTLLAVLERRQGRGADVRAWKAEEDQMMAFIEAIREERKAPSIIHFRRLRAMARSTATTTITPSSTPTTNSSDQGRSALA